MTDAQTVLQIEVPREFLFSLSEWLNSQDELRGRVRPHRLPPAPGRMGAAVELLTVALGSGGTGVVLVRSLCAWLAQRRSEVSVQIRDADGRAVTVTVARARDPESVIRETRSLLGAFADDGGAE
jgi:hypothetical protein